MLPKVKFHPGEKACEICGAPLPAIECSVQRRHFYCDTPACRSAHYKKARGKFVAAGTQPCSAPGCTNYVPAGSYDLNTKHFVCGPNCYKKYLNWTGHLVPCKLCGKITVTGGRPERINHFCCSAHIHQFRSNVIVNKKAGAFAPLLKEYIDTFATTHYRKPYSARGALLSFFSFLNQAKVKSLEQVAPKVISQYIVWLQSGSPRSCYTSYLSMFFKWMIAECRRKAENPVIPRIHGRLCETHLPRPYSEAEIAEIWALLDQRGNTRARLAVAICGESGLRIGEVCVFGNFFWPISAVYSGPPWDVVV